jgi:hypothetical protein
LKQLQTGERLDSRITLCPDHADICLQESMCSNHRAVNQTNAVHQNLEATGIGACACSRHGCFIPHTMVDFQKGERYVFLSDHLRQLINFPQAHEH